MKSKFHNKEGNGDAPFAVVSMLVISVAATAQFKEYVNMPTPIMDWIAAGAFVSFLLAIIIKALLSK